MTIRGLAMNEPCPCGLLPTLSFAACCRSTWCWYSSLAACDAYRIHFPKANWFRPQRVRLGLPRVARSMGQNAAPA
jgi:hypothetical protein